MGGRENFKVVVVGRLANLLITDTIRVSGTTRIDTSVIENIGFNTFNIYI